MSTRQLLFSKRDTRGFRGCVSLSEGIIIFELKLPVWGIYPIPVQTQTSWNWGFTPARYSMKVILTHSHGILHAESTHSLFLRIGVLQDLFWMVKMVHPPASETNNTLVADSWRSKSCRRFGPPEQLGILVEYGPVSGFRWGSSPRRKGSESRPADEVFSESYGVWLVKWGFPARHGGTLTMDGL